MDVLITQKKMTDSEAFVKARGGGNLIGKAMYGGGKITMKQLYLQSFEVVFDAYFKPGLVERFFTRKGQMGGNSQKICMIVEGTRCTASYHEQPLPLYEADLDPDMCQDSTFDKEKIIAQAKRVAMRIMRRHSGHIITSMEVASYRPFYRPYYVAFYGEMEMGKKVRYIAIEADGYKVSDAHERSDQTFSFRQILDQSSNVGISLSVQKMTDGFTKLYEHIQKYNLCEKTGVDYPGEASGTLQPLENWATITGWNVSFGQGVAVTPLQLVRFYGALANDGVEVTPHFLVSKPQTGEVPTYDIEVVIENKAAIPTITDMLKTVVTDGTGKNAQIDGYSVAGKTSTAEIAEGGVYRQGVYNLCFEGFLPDSSSQLVCFVGLNEVPSQGNVSNVFKDIMAFAIDRYKIQPE